MDSKTEEIYKLKPIQKQIAEKMGIDELCCQTAEEMSELLQALMVLRRVRGNGQPTNKTLPNTLHGIIEEIVDTQICLKELIYLLNISYDALEFVEAEKIKRTAARYHIETKEE